MAHQAMAKPVRGGGLRYLVAKALHSFQEALQPSSSAQLGAQLGAKAAQSSASVASGATAEGLGASTAGVWARFLQLYATTRLTTQMYVAGAAMAPSLNRRATVDRDAVEKLVVRLLPRPSRTNVRVGDVVAFSSPLAPATDGAAANVMVRRVAAVEGDELVASSSRAGAGSEGEDEGEEVMLVPQGHCWVLADNEDLKPPQVIDSRSFGHIPLRNILGRVVYAGSSEDDARPVSNNPVSAAVDEAVIEAEVEPELAQLFSAGGPGGDDGTRK